MTQTPKFTDAQAARLAAFLSDPGRPEGTMSYCELAGFLFAVTCAPELIKPSEWLPLIFNESEGGFKSIDEAQEILPAIMALYNYVNHGVLEKNPEFPPRCKVHAEPMANFEPGAPLSQWARGFAGGSDWLAEVWDVYASEEIDTELGTGMLVMSFFASRQLAELCRGEIKSRDMSLEDMAGEMLEWLPAAMRNYAFLGRSLQEANYASHSPEMHEPVCSEKIGRNESCPCGSGKKYKKCCGTTV